MKSNPAENLLQKGQLDGGWTVVKKAPKSQAATGGNFSVGYIVRDNSGNLAFLKALDFSEALKQRDPTILLQSLTTSFNYEKQLLKECKASKFDRVSVSVDDGEVQVGELHSVLPVPYLIFDLAEGDIRSKQDAARQFDLAFCLRALHHCGTGLNQLHSRHIAHQDLKPSNVLVFDNADCKVSDLGRSARLGTTSPIDDLMIPGDHTYAPPELLYGHASTDWRIRRLASDLYQLGSLASFFFTKVGMTAMWIRLLHRSFRPGSWGQSYEAVLPHVRDAHDLAFLELEEQLPRPVRTQLGETVRQLCEPDPILRGHPRSRTPQSNPYSLERYIARFDLLASRAEWQMRKVRV